MKLYSREEYGTIHNEYQETNYCPFCDIEGRKDYIIWKGKYWYLLHNFAPYTGDERHIMAVPIDHILPKTDLSDAHFLELREVYKQVEKFFGNQVYFSFTRETIHDDTRSIDHLHIHFLAGRIKGKFVRKMLELQGFPIKQDLKIDSSGF